MMHAVVIQSSEALMAMENALRKSPRRKTVNQMSGIGFPSGLRHSEYGFPFFLMATLWRQSSQVFFTALLNQVKRHVAWTCLADPEQ